MNRKREQKARTMNTLQTQFDWTERLIALVTNGKSDNTQAAYRAAILDYRQWSAANSLGLSRESVLAYVQHLKDQDYSNSTINQRLTALRMLAKEIRFSPTATDADRATAEGIIAIENLSRRGRRLGHWLSDRQARTLSNLPDRDTLRGKQQYLILALLLGAALRREEAAKLTFDQIQERDGNWLIVNLEGKGDKTRSVHLSPWVIKAVTEWQNATGLSDGKVLRAINKGGRLTGQKRTKGGGMSDGGMTAQAIYNTIKDLAVVLGMPDLGPHSLRRTWAKRAYKMDYPLDQISLMLGHSNLRTTEVYLGLTDLDLSNPVHVTF